MQGEDAAVAKDGASHEERLARMRRPADYPVTLWVFTPINRQLVRGLARAGVAPNLVTVLSVVAAVLCAGCMWQAIAASGEVTWVAGAAVFALLSGWLDALDGDLARYAGRGTPRGGALDLIADRLVEVLFLGVTGAALQVHASEPAAAWWTAAAVAAVLVYYYTADAVVRLVLDAAVHDRARYTVTRETGSGALRFGLYEPFRLGFPVVVAAGLALPALQAVAAVFALAFCWQFLKAMTRT